MTLVYAVCSSNDVLMIADPLLSIAVSDSKYPDRNCAAAAAQIPWGHDLLLMDRLQDGKEILRYVEGVNFDDVLALKNPRDSMIKIDPIL